jgi:peptidoglycan/LPS O-acetylase OafA/YrhL
MSAPIVKTRRNTALEFWRVFASIIIVGYHLSFIFPMSLLPDTIQSSTWLTGGGEVLFIFTLTAGYFMMAAFNSKKNKIEGYCDRSCASRAWEYLASRLSALLPWLVIGAGAGIIAVSLWNQASPAVVANQVINGLWEFLGCYSLGFTAAFSQANGAMWFVSGLFVCSYLLYFMLCRNADLTVGLFAPAVFFVMEGWWCKMGIRASQQAWSTIGSVYYANNMAVNGSAAETGIVGLNNGLIFVLVGLCGGMMMYYAVERLKKVEFSATARALMTILYAVLSVVMIAYCINPAWFTVITLDRMTVHLLCIVLIGMTLLQADAISRALNCEALAGILGYLGSISLQIYLIHMPMTYFIVMIMGRNNTYTFGQLFPFVIIASIAAAALLKFLMDSFKKRKA